MGRGRSGIVLYDSLQARGGGERVALTLQRDLPNADLCVDYLDETLFPELTGGKALSLGQPCDSRAWAVVKGLHNFRRRTAFIRDYDWALFSGSQALAAARHRPHGLNVLYCHTIPRFAYDLREYWLARAGWWRYPLLAGLIRHMRRHYASAIEHMDVIVANSQNVRRRIQRYLGRDSIVVPPPCDTERFTWLSRGDYYLSTARLEPYKRVDRIIEAFRHMPDKQLVVASGGSEASALRQLAAGADNIRFTGWLPDDEMADLVGRSIATIYIPIDEDFGLSPVESMAAGKPVIGVAEGGLLETVVPERTGILLPSNPGMDDIIGAVQQMTPDHALSLRGPCQARASRFDRHVFLRRMRDILEIQ